jgi:hypothetical protein
MDALLVACLSSLDVRMVFVFQQIMYVMVLMTVVTHQMRPLLHAQPV